MIYQYCGPASPATCGGGPEIYPLVCVEGCQCVQGFVLDNGRCIPEEECGCTDNGRYYQVTFDLSYWKQFHQVSVFQFCSLKISRETIVNFYFRRLLFFKVSKLTCSNFSLIPTFTYIDYLLI